MFCLRVVHHPFWSAVTCHRFGPSRPVATLLATGRQRPKRRQVGALQKAITSGVFLREKSISV